MAKKTSPKPRRISDDDTASFEIIPKSANAPSLLGARALTAANIRQYFADRAAIDEACRRLKDKGFEIARVGNTSITVLARPERVAGLFDVELAARDVNVFERFDGLRTTAPSFFVAGKAEEKVLRPDKGLSEVVEAAVLPTPHEFMQSPLPPSVGYHHLDIPADVNLFLNTDKAHKLGFSGKGVRVAMVDTGFYRHPYYVARGYQIDQAVLSPDSIGTNPLDDLNGHGTAEIGNACAGAPNAHFMPVKTSLANATAAFATAVDLHPNIITNSWGRSLPTPPFNDLPADEIPLAAAIAEAVARGIVVCFSAGNGHIGWPAMHEDVIAVGGVYAHADGSLEASDYASSFTTPIFPGRQVPDVSGLVGMRPRGIYIMLPLQPGCSIDQSLSGGAFPNGDETAGDDGWACISGTSASCPQAAGIAALMLECCPDLKPKEVRSILAATGRDVTQGATNPAANQPPGPHNAAVGPDLATGGGLIDATAAVVATMARCGGKCGCNCGCKGDKHEEEKEELERLDYAVKFVCGCAKEGVVAAGGYFTAINVMNPGKEAIRFRKRVSVALPNEKPGHVSKSSMLRLGPNEALEIDCADIMEAVGLPGCCFLKGFVTLQSSAPLEVVAVYTASGADEQVETLHIDTIEPTRVMRKKRKPPEEPPGDDPGKKLPDLVPVPPFPPGPPFFPSYFCETPQQLAIIVRNLGPGAAAATTTRVDFFNGGGVVDVATPPLAPAGQPGAETQISVPIPGRCYNPESCEFRITVNASPADGVQESDTSNNTASGNCVVLL